MVRLVVMLIGAVISASAAFAAEHTPAQAAADAVARSASGCCERICEAETRFGALDGVGWRAGDRPSPFSGAIRFRTQIGDLGRMNDLSHRFDFDLRWTERVADGVRLNLELGTGDWPYTDVIGERHRRHGLKRAWASVHLNEPCDCDCAGDCDCK